MSGEKLNKRYTLGEEIFNAVSHGAGGLLSIAGTVVLIVLCAVYSDAWSVISACVYGASLIILYTMSTLYHAITNEKAKKFFRVMDHNTIFFLIAGTYTPFTLVTLRGKLGWILFGIVWGSALIGIILNSIDLEKFRKPSVVCYILMGWVIIIAVKPMLNSLPGTFACFSFAWRNILYSGRNFLFIEKNQVVSFGVAFIYRCRKRTALFFSAYCLVEIII